MSTNHSFECARLCHSGATLPCLQRDVGQPSTLGPLLQAIASVLQQEITVCKDILMLEDTAAPDRKASDSIKWPTLTLAQLQELLNSVTASSSVDDDDVSTLYKRLQEIDQLRAGFYADASNGSANIIVQSEG